LGEGNGNAACQGDLSGVGQYLLTGNLPGGLAERIRRRRVTKRRFAKDKVDKQKFRSLYMFSVALVGAAVTVLCAWHLPLAQIDAKFVALVLITILIGSRITIKIPRARGQIAVSDTFIFLAILLFGIEAAVVLAAAEALCSSTRFSKKAAVLFFNAGVMALSTFITALTFYIVFPGVSLRDGYTPNLLIALSVMALMQYVFNTGPIAVGVALKTNQSVWQSWRANFLWTSLTYFVGAFGAAVVGRLTEKLGFYAFVATAPIIVVVYFTYRTYLANVEASAAQAETAELHVKELNKYIAEQKRISQALVESEAHFRNAFDYAAIGMALVSPEGNWLRVNRSLCEIVGYSEVELLVSDFQAITHRDDLGADLAEIYRMLSGEILTCQLEKRYLHKIGHDVWVSSSASLVRDAQGRPLHLIFQVQDITERKRAEAAIHTLSLADELTGLCNRRGFLAFCKQYLNSLHRSNKGGVIVYADLDGLKKINDSFGHKEGDRALIKTAELLKETFRSADVLGRLGGDEFTALAAVEPEGGVEKLISRLEQKFANYNSMKLVPYKLSISIGVAQLDANGSETLEDLMALADLAMYENKRGKQTRELPNADSEPSALAVA
jgi:diguanylate cyclase (GGDEF)-like protein/PAS domain S-box-containing protein